MTREVQDTPLQDPNRARQANARSGVLIWLLTIGGIVLAIALATALPGDAPWINDEPSLIHLAYSSTQAGELAQHGLKGTRDTYYGPVPTWIYQAYLAVSTDLVQLVALRALGTMVIVGAGLLWLSRLTSLTPLAIPAFMLSPYLWLWSRQIWDNSFCIPFSLVALVSYLTFLRGRRLWLSITVLSCGLLLLTHLMSVPIIAAMALHAVLFQRQRIWQSRWFLVGPLAAVLLAGWSYWPILAQGIAAGGNRSLPDWSMVLHSLSGAQWFSALGWDRILGDAWWSSASPVLRWFVGATAIAHLFYLGGLVITLRSAIGKRLTADPATQSRNDLAFIGILTVAIQAVYYGVCHLNPEIHYYNASWIAYAGVMWIAVDYLTLRLKTQAVPVLWTTLLLCCLTLFTVRLHQTLGTRSLYFGPTLSNQIGVAQCIGGVGPDCQVLLNVEVIQLMPHRLTTLIALYPPVPMPQAQTASVEYRNDDASNGGVVLLIRSGNDTPAGLGTPRP